MFKYFFKKCIHKLIAYLYLTISKNLLKYFIFESLISFGRHIMNLLFSLLGLSGNFTRHMWNGNDIVWYHLIKLYNDELERNLKLIPKLTSEHLT